MDYDVTDYVIHIRREKSTSKSKNNRISFDEWKEYINKNHEADMIKEGINPRTGEKVTVGAPKSLVKWKDEKKEVIALFSYSEERGEVSVENPDKKIIKKMKEIAKHFNARVQGDNGEYYN